MLQQISFNKTRQVYSYKILDEQGQAVGSAQLRLNPSKSAEMPAGFESHVYYEVEPRYRGKGYATSALKELLSVAKAHQIDGVAATVNTDNLASQRVLEKCGGCLVDKSITATGINVEKWVL